MTIFNGTTGDDYIVGTDGDDEIYGLEGNDNIFGGIGNDILEGGDGIDWIEGGEGDDVIISGGIYNHIYGGLGSDTFRVVSGYINGGDGIDVLNYENEVNSVTVGLTDTIGYSHLYDSADLLGSSIGGASIEEVENVIGGAGNDYIEGNSLANELTGNGGIDNIRGGSGDDIIDGNSGADYLLGQDGNDTINGGTENDNLFGGDGIDTLNGDDGNDWLIGGAGADTLDGGDGRDTAGYFDSLEGVNISLATSSYTGGTAEGDTLTNIQNLSGSEFDDTIEGDDDHNILTGRGGNDIIIGGAGVDSIEGGSGNDDIDGGSSNDYIYGDEGDDIIRGGLGADYLNGGGGIDTLMYDDSDTAIDITLIDGFIGSGGTFAGDEIYNFENVVATNFNDTLTGNDLDNTLDGGAGDDTIHSGLGADTLIGGDGIDTLSYLDSNEAVVAHISGGGNTGGHALGDTNSGFEIMHGSIFDDELYGSTLAETIYGEDGNDYIDASRGNDNIYGGDGDDEIYGSYGNDIIYGGLGDDTIYGSYNNNIIEGGAGADNMDGGYHGNDTLVYRTSDGAVDVSLLDNTASGGHAEGDTIANFEHLIGSGFDDILIGNNGDNIIEGLAGADYIDGGGGSGDYVIYTESFAGVNVNLSTGVGTGGEAEGDIIINIEHIKGSNYDDELIGNENRNSIFGGDGDDYINTMGGTYNFIYGGLGADIIDANGWADTVYYTDSIEAVTVYLDGTVCSGGTAEGDIIKGALRIKGSDYDDNLFGDEFNNTFYGGLGADIIEGGAGIDFMYYTDSTVGVTAYLGGTVGLGGTAEGDTITNIENLYGSAHDDTLIGDENNNNIYGYYGDDNISGGAGNDKIYGSRGADIIDGGEGTEDWVYYDEYYSVGVTVSLVDGTGFRGIAEGDVISNIENIYGSGWEDILTGDDNDNTFFGGGGADYIDGLGGNDTASYSGLYTSTVIYLDGTVCGGGSYSAGDILTNIENVIGANGIDKIYGDNKDNTIEGGGNNDIIEGGAGADTLDGGSNIWSSSIWATGDTVVYSNSNTAVNISLLDNTASGGHADGDIISGFENITGSAYDDTLIGSYTVNIIEGGAGADTIDGLGSNDTILYASSTAGVTVYLDGTVCSGGDAEGDIITNIEYIMGSDYDDTIIGNDVNNIIYGEGGADYIDGGAGTDDLYYNTSSSGVTVYMDGTVCSGGDAEGDTIINIENVTGSNYDDVLVGNDGNNIIYGKGGADYIDGGLGNDAIYGGYGADTIDGGDGISDCIYYTDSAVRVTVYLDGTICSGGEAEGDVISNIENIYGSSHDDIIIGDANDNVIYSTGGADTIYGGDGIDTYQVHGWNSGSFVTIHLDGAACSGGYTEGDILVNIENVIGSGHNDIIYGNELDNNINGYYGNDVLYGGAGADTLTGYNGNDTFAYELATDSISTAYDTITDFGTGDNTLQFEDSVFGNDWTVFNMDISTGDTIITHSTLTDFEIHLTGAYTLTETDFSFV